MFMETGKKWTKEKQNEMVFKVRLDDYLRSLGEGNFLGLVNKYYTYFSIRWNSVYADA